MRWLAGDGKFSEDQSVWLFKSLQLYQIVSYCLSNSFEQFTSNAENVVSDIEINVSQLRDGFKIALLTDMYSFVLGKAPYIEIN